MTIPNPPHALDLVINFVNTLDIEGGTDALSKPHDLAVWLNEAQLLATSGEQLDEAERQRAVRLREALRALMLANNGATPDEHAGRELERAARDGELGVHFTDSGTVSFAPAARGLAGALARLLIPVADAVGDGSWQRVKACRSPDCQWAFYDRSRNHSGVWCDMAICGNRTKVRAYRDRAGDAPGRVPGASGKRGS